MSEKDPWAPFFEEAPPAAPSAERSQVEQALRWRLVLGQFADEHLGFDGLAEAGGEDLAETLLEAQQVDMPLSYIYDREHQERMHRQASKGGPSGLTVPMWLNRVRELFPGEAVKVMEQDALIRYGMQELVTDPEILRRSEPTEALLKAILQFKHLMKGEVVEAAKEVVEEVIASLRARLESDCRPALHGPIDPYNRSPMRTFRNTDWRRTIDKNLKHYDPERERLIADRIHFKHRQRARSPWRVIMAVDQSGSMTDSLIHASVMSAIFCRLPSVSAHLVLWDHRYVDVSPLAHHPLEVRMCCQLGGGTQMFPAMEYCASLVVEPRRTIFVLLSDWFIWGEKEKCLELAAKLKEAGVHGVGLSALDAECQPVADEGFAKALAGVGWFVAAMTPKRLAEYVGRILA